MHGKLENGTKDLKTELKSMENLKMELKVFDNGTEKMENGTEKHE